MGKFRKASQLTRELETISTYLTAAKRARDFGTQQLVCQFFPSELQVMMEAISFYNAQCNKFGNGVRVMLANQNAAVLSHIKFHPKTDDRDSSELCNLHIVIESVKYLNEDSELVELKFNDDNRSIHGEAIQSKHDFLVDGRKRTHFPPPFEAFSELRKPRFDLKFITDFYTKRVRFFIKEYPGYELLKNACASVSELPSLLAHLEKVGTSFQQIVLRANDRVFSESMSESADEVLTLSDNAADRFTVEDKYAFATPTVAYVSPQADLESALDNMQQWPAPVGVSAPAS